MPTSLITAAVLLGVGAFSVYTAFPGFYSAIWPLQVLALIMLLPMTLVVAGMTPTILAFVLASHAVFYVYGKGRYALEVGLDDQNVAAIWDYILFYLLVIVSYISASIALARKKTLSPVWLEPSEILICGGIVLAPLLVELPPIFGTIIFACIQQGAIVLLLSCECKHRKYRILATLIAIGAGVITFVQTAFLYPLAVTAGLYTASRILQRRLRQLMWIPLILTLMLIANPVKGRYRQLVWGTGLSLQQKIGALYISLSDRGSIAETEASGTTSRLADHTLERVKSITPSQEPFWKGRTYAQVWYLFIPRFLWRDKPGADFSNEFGRKFGFLDEDDTDTAVLFNFASEGYLNYGVLGMYLAAVVLGLILALFEAFALVVGNYTSFAFIVAFVPFMAFESGLGTSIQYAVTFMILLLLTRITSLRRLFNIRARPSPISTAPS